MRNLKKIAALFVALTMVLALVVVPVYAADNVKLVMSVDKATMKVGSTITMNIYLEGPTDAYDARMMNYEIAYDTAKFEITNVPIAATEESTAVTDGAIKMTAISKVSTTKTAPIQTVTIKALQEVTDATFAFSAIRVVNTGYEDAVVDSTSTVTLTATPSWTANAATATPATKSYPIGTDVAAALANDIAVTVTDGTRTEAGYTATWECAEANCDLTVPATHEFKGLVAGPIEENAANWTGELKATVTVTLTALTDGDIQETLPALTKNKTQEAGTYVAADALADLAAKGVTKVTLKNGAIEDTVTLTADMITVDPVVDTAVLANHTITVTIPAGTKSDNNKFELAAAKTLTTTFDVIPAEIKDGSVKWTVKSDSATADGVIEIAVAYEEGKEPASDVAATVNLVLKDGETVVATKNDVALGTIAAGAKSASFKTASLETIFGAGVPKDGNVVVAEIKLAGASVSYDGIKEGDVTKTIYVLAVTADSSTTTGLPSGGTAGPVVDGSDAEEGEEGEEGEDGTEGTEGTEEGEEGTEEGDVVTGDAAFADIDGHWAAEYIEVLADAGIVNGKTADTFEPDTDVTRAEFVKMIAVAYNMTATGTETAFEDVQDHWAKEYIIAATEAGYVTGMDATYFGADESISRQDICTILGRILGTQEDVEAAAFVDAADIADYAAPYVNLLAGMGIVNGYEDGTFAPEANATRAEVAKILVGFLGLNAAE